jgi:hypothetical protein
MENKELSVKKQIELAAACRSIPSEVTFLREIRP